MQGLHPRTQQKSRRLKEEPHMHRQRKHRTYGVSAVCRKSAGIEKHTGSDSARSIRIPNVEEAALTERLEGTVCLRPVMVELAGLKAFYGRFLDKNGICW